MWVIWLPEAAMLWGSPNKQPAGNEAPGFDWVHCQLASPVNEPPRMWMPSFKSSFPVLGYGAEQVTEPRPDRRFNNIVVSVTKFWSGFLLAINNWYIPAYRGRQKVLPTYMYVTYYVWTCFYIVHHIWVRKKMPQEATLLTETKPLCALERAVPSSCTYFTAIYWNVRYKSKISCAWDVSLELC